MRMLFDAQTAIIERLEGLAPIVLPTLARFIFAATLFWYYVNSGIQKFGEGFAGLFAPSAGAYVTIFPKTFEAVGYDVTQLGTFHYLIALSGTWAEVILPVLILIGLFTRIAALGMIVVVIVQSVVDIFGHGLAEADIGKWFDNLPTALIIDQRAFWIFLLAYLVFRGPGPFSLDRFLAPKPVLAHA